MLSSDSARLFFFGEQPKRKDKTEGQRDHGDRPGGEHQFVAPNQFFQAVNTTGRARQNRFVRQVALEIQRQLVGGLITARALLFQTLHDDPIQVAAD